MTSLGADESLARRRNLVANLGGRSVSLLATIVFLPLYLELLGPDEYGLVGFYATLLALLAVSDFGLTATLTREMARLSGTRDTTALAVTLRTIETVFFAIVAVVAVSAFGCADWIAERWISSDTIPAAVVARAIRLMTLAAVLQVGSTMYSGALAGLQRQVVQNAITISAGILRGVGAIVVLTLVADTATAFFAWQIVVNLLQLVALRWMTARSIPGTGRRPRFDPATIARVRSYALGMMAMSVTSSILLQADKLFLARALPLATFGYYSISWTMSQMPAAVLSTPVRVTFFPRLTQLAEAGDEAEFARLYHVAAEIVSLLIVPIIGVLVAVPEEVLWVWLGNEQASMVAAPTLRVLAIGGGLTAILVIPYAAQLAHGWTGLSVKANLIATVLYVPAMAWVTAVWGALGAAWLWVGWNLSYLGVVLLIMHRRILLREARPWLWESLLRPAIIVGGPLVAAAAILEPGGGRLAGLVTLAAVWGVCQMMLLSLSRRTRNAWSQFVGTLRGDAGSASPS